MRSPGPAIGRDGLSLSRDQILQGLANIVHVHRVIRLFPERVSGRVPDNDAVRAEPELLHGLAPFRSCPVTVLSPGGPGKLVLEPAHGGHQSGTDLSAGEVIIGDDDLLRDGRPATTDGEQGSRQSNDGRRRKNLRRLSQASSFVRAESNTDVPLRKTGRLSPRGGGPHSWRRFDPSRLPPVHRLARERRDTSDDSRVSYLLHDYLGVLWSGDHGDYRMAVLAGVFHDPHQVYTSTCGQFYLFGYGSQTCE